jgi:hypothetical protein
MIGHQQMPTSIACFPLAGLLACLLFGAVGGQDARPADKKASLPAVEKDLPYGAGGDEQMLDLYLPDKEGFTTIVFTYGGGWRTGSRKTVTPIGEKLRGLGYGCALLSHRPAPKDRFPAQAEDVAAAFAWVKKNIAVKGGDPKRWFSWGTVPAPTCPCWSPPTRNTWPNTSSLPRMPLAWWA